MESHGSLFEIAGLPWEEWLVFIINKEKEVGMNKKTKALRSFSLLAITVFVLGVSFPVYAGHLIIEEGSVYLTSPCDCDPDVVEYCWVGTVSKQILGEDEVREGTVVAVIKEEIFRGKGKVRLQTVQLTETYEAGLIYHESKAKVTPSPEPDISNVQALTTVTGGTDDFALARGVWSVRGVLDVSGCSSGGDLVIDLEIKGGFIDGPNILDLD